MNEKKEVIIEMMMDYLKYGYGLRFFKEQKYPVTNGISDEELDKLWETSIKKMVSY